MTQSSCFSSKLVALIVASGTFAASVSAQCTWSWASGFERSGGPVENVWDSVVFDDGTGEALYICTDPGRVYKFDGQRWTKIGHAYGNLTGVAGGFTYKMAVVDPDGPGPMNRQLFVVGYFRRMASPTQTSANASIASGVARWNGSSWTNEGTSQMQVSVIRGAAAFNDGTGEKLYIGGQFAIGVGRGIAVRGDNGSWSLVGNGLAPYLTSSNEVSALHAFDDGTGSALYVGGLFEGIGGTSSPGVIKWTGTAWQGLGAGVQYTTGEGGRVYGLTSFDDGSGPKLIASGNIASSGGDTSVRGVAKWNGTTWTGFGADFVVGRFGPYVKVLDYGSGPSLHVNGPLGSMAAQGVARWNGTAWESPNWTVEQGNPLSINTFDPDGAGPAPTRLVAMTNTITQLEGTSWNPLPYYPDSQALNSIVQLAALDVDAGGPVAPALYATGVFATTQNGQPVNNLGRFDGAAWTPAFGGLPTLERRDAEGNIGADGTTCVQVFDDGSGPALYVGGGFNYNDNIKACRIMKWNGAAFVEVGGGIGLVENNGHSVITMAAFDEPGPGGPSLYASGSFVLAGATTVSNIARWDGTAWSDVGGGVDGIVNTSAVFDDGTGPALYVAGNFTSAGGTPTPSIARWNGAAWSDVGGGIGGTVSKLVVHDDGTGAGSALFAGGQFATAGGGTVNHIAKWNGSAWIDLAAGVARGAGITGTAAVRSLVSLQEGASNVLIAGGTFERAGGVTVNYIGRWNGTGWSAMEGGVSGISVGTPAVNQLAAVNMGAHQRLFASGTFIAAGPTSAGGFAQWSFDQAGTCCPVDFNSDGTVDFFDYLDFVDAFSSNVPAADFNSDGVIDFFDYLDFVDAFSIGC